MPDDEKNGRRKQPEEATSKEKSGARTDQKRAEEEERRTLNETPSDVPAGSSPEKPADDTEQEQGDGRIPESDKPEQAAADRTGFPVVGIGASAGGLDALETFMAALPEKSGIAFVVITHTHPEYKTRMPELLQRKTKCPVVLLEDRTILSPDTIYVPPSDLDPVFENGVLRLQERPGRPDVHMPIDRFFNSLAQDRGEAAGCIVLSGTGTDGSQGLRRIKEHAGVAVAQSRDSARHTGMPDSAVETGMVDFILDPAEMPERLIKYFQHPASIRTEPPADESGGDALPKILSFLNDRTRHDFSNYKKSTINRRIERRMNVTQCRTTGDYLRFLHRHPDEAHALFQDLLIGVTNFFRDPEVFEFMKEKVLPDLISRGKYGKEFRVWIPGCSTGEEAYSVAIIIREAMAERGIKRPMQIFATDIDADAIGKARQGTYPANIATDVSEERLREYFHKEGHYYRIKRELREPVVFAEQNVLRDPPFVHLDLLVCRNLLIYLEPQAQNKLLPLFHYNLKTNGILFLGTSESTGRFADLFEPVNKRFSIYRKRDVRNPLHYQMPFTARPPEFRRETDEAPGRDIVRGENGRGETDLAHALEKKLLKEHTPPCVVVNKDYEIRYIHGRTGRYLEHAPGRPNLRITDMAREGLRHALSSALRQARDDGGPVRETGLRVKTNGDFARLDLTVEPARERFLKDGYLIFFHEVPESAVREREAPETAAGSGHFDEAAARRIADLERELENLRADYHIGQEDLETSLEELKSANEEMYSSNEELQSTNEELESSREELESLNEELSTVNSELHDKIAESQELYNNITEVLNSTGIAIVFLDNNLEVRRFTEKAAQLINLIDKDVGRAFDHITHNLEFDHLQETVRRVLKNLTPFEENVRTRDGHWYRMRIMVNRTGKNAIEGAVLTFVNIDVQKKVEEELRQNNEKAITAAERFAENIVDTVRESLLVLDSEKRVVMANRSFYQAFATSAEQTEGRSLFRLGNDQWNIPELRRLLDEIIETQETIEDFRVEHRFPEIGLRRMRLNARLLREKEGENRILLAIEDVTNRPE